jgi:hypothetical protein
MKDHQRNDWSSYLWPLDIKDIKFWSLIPIFTQFRQQMWIVSGFV